MLPLRGIFPLGSQQTPSIGMPRTWSVEVEVAMKLFVGTRIPLRASYLLESNHKRYFLTKYSAQITCPSGLIPGQPAAEAATRTKPTAKPWERKQNATQAPAGAAEASPCRKTHPATISPEAPTIPRRRIAQRTTGTHSTNTHLSPLPGLGHFPSHFRTACAVGLCSCAASAAVCYTCLASLLSQVRCSRASGKDG